MSASRHATKNPADRAIGEKWESKFSQMAEAIGVRCPDRHPEPPEPWWPIGKLPDRIAYRETSEWHELKHKAPTWRGEYGLEQYRLEAFVKLAKHVVQPVLYTIHDWRMAGASNSGQEVDNRLDDWFTADVTELDKRIDRAEDGLTYYNGERAKTTIFYWKTRLWEPLARRWGLSHGDPRAGKDANGDAVKHVHGYTGYGADGRAVCIADYHGKGVGCGDVLVRPDAFS